MAQYTIQKKDTLSGIAVQNKTTVSELLKLNPQIKDPDLIFIGNTLNLPELSEQKNLPITSSIQGDSPETLIQRIQEQKGEMPKTNLSEERVSSAPIIFNSTDNLRNENKIKKIKEELNLGEKPVSPFSFSETDKTKLETTTELPSSPKFIIHCSEPVETLISGMLIIEPVTVFVIITEPAGINASLPA